MLVHGGHLGFLTGDLEEMAILDIMDDLILPQGRYSVQFVLIYLLEVCREWGVKKDICVDLLIGSVSRMECQEGGC